MYFRNDFFLVSDTAWTLSVFPIRELDSEISTLHLEGSKTSIQKKNS